MLVSLFEHVYAVPMGLVHLPGPRRLRHALVSAQPQPATSVASHRASTASLMYVVQVYHAVNGWSECHRSATAPYLRRRRQAQFRSIEASSHCMFSWCCALGTPMAENGCRREAPGRCMSSEAGALPHIRVTRWLLAAVHTPVGPRSLLGPVPCRGCWQAARTARHLVPWTVTASDAWHGALA